MHLSTHLKKIQVSIMFLKHLQTHGAPGKGKKAPKIKGTLKRLYTNIFVISIDGIFRFFKL